MPLNGVGDVPSRGVWVPLTEILFPLTEIWGSPVRGGVLPCGGGRPSLYGGSGSPVPGFGFPCTGKRAGWKVPDGDGTAKRAAADGGNVL